jgi:hypothetical protein
MYLTASGSIIAVKRERSYGVEGFLNLDGDLDAKGIPSAETGNIHRLPVSLATAHHENSAERS